MGHQVVAALALIARHIVGILSTPGAARLPTTALTLLVIAAVAGACLVIVGVVYIGWLVDLLPDMRLRSRMSAYQVVVPVLYIGGFLCFGIGPVLAMLLIAAVLYRVSGQFRRIRFGQVPATPT